MTDEIKNFVSDEEFYYFLNGAKDLGYSRLNFTDEQITRICKAYLGDGMWKWSTFELIVKLKLPLTAEHIDILLTRPVLAATRNLFMHAKKLEPRHIEFGLQSSDVYVRQYASEHACCTDAQRVKYELTAFV